MMPAIVYVVSRWGEPSQTFVRREAAAMAALDVDISAMSLKSVGAESGGVDAVRLGLRPVLAGVVRAALRRPGAVARIYATILRSGSLRNTLSHLLAATIGLAWVGSGRLPRGHLHTHFGWVAATAAWAAARASGRTYSVQLHAFEIHDVRYLDRFTAVPLREARRVFVESESDRDLVARRWGIRAVVAHLGVPSDWLDEGDEPRDASLLVSVGRLVEKKGFPVLIEALHRSASTWRAVIVGDGPLAEPLRAQVERLGLGDRVRLAGHLPEVEVRRLLHRAAVMCLASVEVPSGDRDGTPMAIVEAMAAGAVVLSTDAGAISELVGEAGVIVRQDDPQALAEALDGLADPDRRADLAEQARVRVRTSWTAEATAEVLRAELWP